VHLTGWFGARSTALAGFDGGCGFVSHVGTPEKQPGLVSRAVRAGGESVAGRMRNRTAPVTLVIAVCVAVFDHSIRFVAAAQAGTAHNQSVFKQRGILFLFSHDRNSLSRGDLLASLARMS
jgi:hypothetical protein